MIKATWATPLTAAAVCMSLAQVSCGDAEGGYYDGSDGVHDVAEQPLNGNTNFPGDHQCRIPQHLNKAVAAVSIARQRLDHPEMALCLREHFTSATNGASPERILRQLRENKETNIKCRQISDPTAAAQAPIGVSHEEVTFDIPYLDAPGVTDADRAELLLHEVAHNKGYTHGDDAGTAGEYFFTVNEQVRACARAITFGSRGPDNGLGPILDAVGLARSELVRATHQAPIGGFGGTPNTVNCGSGRFARGLTGRFSGLVNQIGLVCGDVNGNTPGLSTVSGGTGGSPFTEDCGNGSLMVGMRGWGSDVTNQVQPLCKTAADIRNNTGFTRVLTARGGATGDFFERRCPNGMAVKRAYLRTSDRVNRVVLECQRLDMPQDPQLSALGLRGGSGGTPYRERCPTGSVMTAITGQAAAEVDRLGGVCTQVRTITDPSGVVFARKRDQQPITIEAHGGFGGSGWPSSEACAASEALVGLNVRAGSRIDRIQGICANVERWSDERVTTVATRLLPAHGGNGGSPSTLLCPREYFLQGWEMRAGSRIDRIVPMCVRAEQ